MSSCYSIDIKSVLYPLLFVERTYAFLYLKINRKERCKVYRMTKQALCVQCHEKRTKWERLQTIYLEKGEKEIARFRENIASRKAKLVYSVHYFKNLQLREYSYSDVEKALLYGRLIERNKLTNETNVSYTLLYFTKNKAMHVVLERLNGQEYMLKTVYNPNAHAWKWNDTFDKRICFCKGE